MSESAQREMVFEAHESRNRRRLRVLREAMALLYRSRLAELGFDRAYVSGNDCRRWLMRNPEYDTSGSANWRAAVFASKEWAWTGQMVESTARGGHRTKLQAYRLVGVPK
jgi:hypothetical protein